MTAPATLTPVVHTLDAGALGAPDATRSIGQAGDTVAALPLRPTGSRPLEPAVDVATADTLDGAPLRPGAAGTLSLPAVPTTPPILADAPTFYARGEPGEPDLAGGRAIRAHGAAGHTTGVEDGADSGTGRAYRGGLGDFHVDTSDAWASTPQVTLEAWVKPATLTGEHSLLDARSVHRDYGDRWLWTIATSILGFLVRTLVDILSGRDVLDEWRDWRYVEAFTGWRDWWNREALRYRRHHMGWELWLDGGRLTAYFGTGHDSQALDGAVSATGVLSAGQWAHVAATCDGATRQLYVDGALVATAVADDYVPPVPGVDLVIGRSNTSRAAVDEIAVFDRALPPERIAAHHAGLGAGATTGILDALRALPLRPAATNPIVAADDIASGLAQQPEGSHPITPAAALERGLPLVDPVTDQDFADAIADALRHPILEVRADWDRDDTFGHPLSDLTDLVVDLSIDRSISGDLPPEAGLVEGHAAAAMSLTLAGQWDTALDTGVTGPHQPASTDVVAAFAPYLPDAPLYGYPTIGTPIEADLGFLTRRGPDLRRRFTGTVSRLNPSSARRDVALDALDGANQMRAPITQAPWGMDSQLLARYGHDRYNARTNSQWLIDRVFRANGWYASPPPQPGSFLSVTMHGSAIPEIGTGGVPRQASVVTPSAPSAWTNQGHPHGMLYPAPGSPAQSGTWSADEVLTMFPGDGVGCSFLMRAPTRPVYPYLMGIRIDGGPISQTDSMYAVVASLSAGAPAMIVYTPADGPQGVAAGDWDLPATPEWRHVGMHWAFRDGACDMTLAVDGQRYLPVTVPINIGVPRMQPWAPTTTVDYEFGACVSNVCWWRAPEPPEQWYGANHISEADIDPGMGEWTGIPQLAGEESWPLATEVAAAEAATIGFSLTGRPFYRSRAVDRERPAAEELTAQRELADLVTVTDEASVRNSITSATTPLLVADYEWVVEAGEKDQFECGPGSTLFTVPLPPDTVAVDPLYVAQLNEPGYLDIWDEVSDRPDWRAAWMFCAVYSAQPTLPVAPALISMRLFSTGAGGVTFTIFNYSGRTIRFQTEDTLSDPDPETGEVTVTEGQAAFRIPGRLLKAQATVPQTITDPGSIDRFGARTLDLGGGSNRWHQHPRSIEGVAEAILSQTAHPAPVLDAVTVPHDPRRDLAGAVTLVDPAGLGSLRGTITGLSTSWSPSSAATDDLAVRPLAPPGFGLLDDPEQGGIGTTLRFGA